MTRRPTGGDDDAEALERRRERRRRERAAQGLPPEIIDPVALDRVAQVLLRAEARIEAERRPAKKARRAAVTDGSG